MRKSESPLPRKNTSHLQKELHKFPTFILSAGTELLKFTVWMRLNYKKTLTYFKGFKGKNCLNRNQKKHPFPILIFILYSGKKLQIETCRKNCSNCCSCGQCFETTIAKLRSLWDNCSRLDSNINNPLFAEPAGNFKQTTSHTHQIQWPAINAARIRVKIWELTCYIPKILLNPHVTSYCIKRQINS